MANYQIQSHAEFLAQHGARQGLVDLTAPLDRLAQAAFAEYDDVIAAPTGFKRWFTKRPGMTDDSRFVAVADGEPVASVFVTVTPMQWGGELMTAGLIDSVMTHPGHRRRGLARAVLARAIDFMRERGVDVSLLYTVAGTVPYDFYASVGYVDTVRVHVLERAEGGQGAPLRSSQSTDTGRYRTLLNNAFADHDGYLPMSEELWRWRREQRPEFMPVEIRNMGDDEPAAIFAVGQAPIRKGDGCVTKTFLNDVIVLDGPCDFDVCREILAAAPAGAPVMTACAVTNEPDLDAFLACGLELASPESCMIKPLSDRAARALWQNPSRWYPVTETIVGL